MSERTLSESQANRLRNDFKRTSYVVGIILLRLEEKPIEDPILCKAITLFTEEHDKIYSDFAGMLDSHLATITK